LIKKIRSEEAVGRQLCHDITEIRPGEFKGAAFRAGHTVCEEDVCNLQRLGKNHVYVLDMEAGEIHENDAAAILADALAGDGVVWKDGPTEGKINLLADRDGLLVVDHTSLAAFNLVDEVMCATLHSHTLPGSMFLVAYLGGTPLLGVPACGLYHRITALDLILPRILAGERIGKKELAFLGHGGLCLDCPQCAYPHCPFGKGT
jgi:hypothetical protein